MTAWTQTPTDPLGPSDAGAAFQHALTGVDPLGLTDAVTVVKVQSPADSVTLTDSGSLLQHQITGLDQISLADTATLVLVQPPGPSIADQQDLSDAGIGVQHTFAGVEPLGLTDAALLTVGRAPVDALGLTDAASVIRGFGTTDSMGLSDSVTMASAKAILVSDAVLLTDATSQAKPSSPSAANRSPFRIQIYNTNFAKQGEVNSYQSVEFTLRLNAVGSWTIRLNPSDQAVVQLVQKRRRITVDYKGVRILSGPVEMRRQVRDENGLRLYEFGGPDDLVWLADRPAFPNPGGTIPGDNVVFTQTVADDIRRGNGETVIKGFVSANAGSAGVYPIPAMTVATNANRGSTTTGSARMVPLLDVVAAVANGSGLALSLKQVGAGLVFDVTAPQTQPVRLSENLKNLKAWEYVEEAPGATAVVVGGRGDGTAKKFLTQTNATAEVDWEKRVQFFDATDVDLDADLPIRAAEFLGQNAPQAGFLVTPEDSDSMSFGLHYNLNDVVQVEVADGVFESDTVKQVVLGHAVGGAATVQPAVGNLDAADKTNAIYRKYGDLLRRLVRLERKT